MSYQVGIDVGTVHSVTAVCRSDGGAAGTGWDGRRPDTVPTAVFAGVDGTFVVGEAAERRALTDPGRVVREFTRRIGDATPVLVGRDPVPAEDLAARFVSRLLDDVAEREGAPASRLAVTHPAGWGPHKIESMRAGLAEHGMASALVLSEPQAAAMGYAAREQVEPGAVVAVYDLGGGTFDASVLRRTADGFELLGPSEGIERLGGVDFDEVVLAHVRAALGPTWEALDVLDPDVLAAVAGLRRECTAAKEALSRDTEVLVPVLLPGAHTHVRLGRAEFEDMIRPALLETVDVLRRSLDSAGVAPAELTALLLVGGSSRIPLVTQLLAEAVGRAPAAGVDPERAIATGAAWAARASMVPVPVPVSLSVPVERGAVSAGVGSAGVGPAGVGPDGARFADAERPAVGAAADPQPDPPAADVPAVDVPAADVPSAGPAPRPPKQARPFAGGPVAAPEPGRRVAVAVASGLLALALVGGAVAIGVTRIGSGGEAGASTPGITSTVGTAPGSSPAGTAPLQTPPSATRPAPVGTPAERAARPPAPQPQPVAPPRTTTAPAPGPAATVPGPGVAGGAGPTGSVESSAAAGGEVDDNAENGGPDSGDPKNGADEQGPPDETGAGNGAADDGAAGDGAAGDDALDGGATKSSSTGSGGSRGGGATDEAADDARATVGAGDQGATGAA